MNLVKNLYFCRLHERRTVDLYDISDRLMAYILELMECGMVAFIGTVVEMQEH